MARTARPWFRGQIGWWCAYIDGRQVRLAKGKKNKGEANRKLQELLFGRNSNPAPGESAEPTVASIIETYLVYAEKRLGGRTLEERTHYLQAFAEAHGWRKVGDCLPFHLTSWLDANPQWKSAWTVSSVVNIVQRPFRIANSITSRFSVRIV